MRAKLSSSWLLRNDRRSTTSSAAARREGVTAEIPEITKREWKSPHLSLPLRSLRSLRLNWLSGAADEPRAKSPAGRKAAWPQKTKEDAKREQASRLDFISPPSVLFGQFPPWFQRRPEQWRRFSVRIERIFLCSVEAKTEAMKPLRLGETQRRIMQQSAADGRVARDLSRCAPGRHENAAMKALLSFVYCPLLITANQSHAAKSDDFSRDPLRDGSAAPSTIPASVSPTVVAGRSESRRKTLLNFFLRLAATRAFRSMPGGEARPTLPSLLMGQDPDWAGSGQRRGPQRGWEGRRRHQGRALCGRHGSGFCVRVDWRDFRTRPARRDPFAASLTQRTSIPNGTESAVSFSNLFCQWPCRILSDYRRDSWTASSGVRAAYGTEAGTGFVEAAIPWDLIGGNRP